MLRTEIKLRSLEPSEFHFRRFSSCFLMARDSEVMEELLRKFDVLRIINIVGDLCKNLCYTRKMLHGK